MDPQGPIGVNTFAEYAKAMTNEQPGMKHYIRVLTKATTLLNAAHWSKCNKGDMHETDIQTALPKSYIKDINAGVPASFDGSRTIVDKTIQIEQNCILDSPEVEKQSSPRAYRMRKSESHMISAKHNLERRILYDTYNSGMRKIMGFMPRYGSVSDVALSRNVINAGGTTANKQTSILFVTWGDMASKMVSPDWVKNPMGLQRMDKGKVDAILSSDGTLVQSKHTEIYKDVLKWNAGLVVEDWRVNVRIANIDVDQRDAGTLGAKRLTKLMIEARDAIPDDLIPGVNVNMRIYMNRKTHTAFKKELLDTAGAGGISLGDADGRQVLMFQNEIPILRNDMMLDTEEVLT